MKDLLDSIRQASSPHKKNNTKKTDDKTLSGEVSKFKKVLISARQRSNKAPLYRTHALRSKNMYALNRTKWLYRISELQLLIRQLRMKTMHADDSDLLNAQLSAAQDELFRLMVKYQS